MAERLQESLTQTWSGLPKRPRAASRRACLVHIYPAGPGVGSCYELTRAALVIGYFSHQLAERLARLCHGRSESERKHERHGRERPKDRTCQDDLL